MGDARRAAAGALAAAALHAVLVLHGASWHSAVFDEVVYPAAGYATLRTGEVRLNREHPPLMKLLTGAAWLGTGLPVTEAPGWNERDQWRFGRHLLYGAGQDAAALLFRARVPVALLSAALLLGVWGASATSAYAVGAGGVILRLAETGEWQSMKSGVSDDIVAISGLNQNVWAVTDTGLALRLDGSTWRIEPSPAISGYGGVFVQSGSRVFGTGNLGGVIRFDH